MIDPNLLAQLRCPETRQPLQAAEPALLQQLNASIDAGELRNRGGQPVKRRCDGGLVRQDGQYLYPVCEDIAVLLVDEAIPLEAAQASPPGKGV
jgi:uncharacterized protein YbaR (Trm112 family)